MQIGFPYAIAFNGRTALDASDAHVRAMIEQLLLTDPGERVNRPDFGGGLSQLLFAPNSPELAATLQFTLRAAVQRYLSDVIDLSDLTLIADNERLFVEVKYVLRSTGAVSAAQVELAPGVG